MTVQQVQAEPATPGAPPEPTVRLTLLGPTGRVDLAVPTWVEVAALAQEYASRVGGDPGAGIGRVDGRALEPGKALEDSSVSSGDILVVRAAPDRGASGPEASIRPRSAAPDSRPSPARLRTATAVLAALTAAGAAGVAAASDDLTASVPAWVRPACAGLLLLAALVGALSPTAPESGTRAATSPLGTASAPAFGAAAGFVAAYSSGDGGILLALAVAGLLAVVVAALARAGTDDERDDVLQVWLVAAGLTTAVAVIALLLGASLLGVLALGFTLAVLATRMLPPFVVDVPDEALLDLDRLAVTAWSARERPRSGRRRNQVAPSMVAAVVERGQRLVASGVVVSAVVTSVSGPLVAAGVGGDPTSWARAGAEALVLSGAAALGLVARTFRTPLPRLVLGGSAAWLTVFTGWLLLADLGGSVRWYAVVVAALVAPALVLVAQWLGRGGRSVWWGRVGEIGETLTGIAVLALLPLACGLFDLLLVNVG